MPQNDNDIVRGVGFVTIYSAYVEEQVDKLRFSLIEIEALPAKWQRWPISERIEKTKPILRSLEFEGRDDLLLSLDMAKKAFEERNEIIHGRIYPNFDGTDDLISGRLNTPTRRVNAEELYNLTNHFYDLYVRLDLPLEFKLQLQNAFGVSLKKLSTYR